MKTNVSDAELREVLQQVGALDTRPPTVIEHDRPSSTLFDPNIIDTFARRLYLRAGLMVVWYGVIGFLSGAAVAGSIYYYLPAAIAKEHGVSISVVLLVLFSAVGAVIGNAKAFQLRFQAQMALCQVEIERNTRMARHR